MDMLIVSASPRRGGNSDTLAKLTQEALAEQGIASGIRTVHPSHHAPCIACGFCAKNRGQCVLDKAPDNTADLLESMRTAKALFLIMPVFFYGPPAQCKAVMDRAQKYWWILEQDPKTIPLAKPGFLAFVAARTQGEQLFEANALIGRCFLRTLGFAPPQGAATPLCLKGLDGPRDLADHSTYGDVIRAHTMAMLDHLTKLRR